MSAQAAKASKANKARWWRAGLWMWWTRGNIGSGPMGLEVAVMMFNIEHPAFHVTAQEAKDCPMICRRWWNNARCQFDRREGKSCKPGTRTNNVKGRIGAGYGVRPRRDCIQYAVKPS